ncbi:TorF family putative porin [Bowmanella dokdonensis]|uniref:Porin n=1 Tax=Bowmanella dokdonensis TaxID=751969 RepID=A0A939DS31_9ALTE|nr:TorF family putative porin [Bowmanella dokdonensis]MBN7827648.1 hypothetical protein [Bowmanella dokdonensis]
MKIKHSLIATSLMAGLSLSAQAEVSGYVTLTSDYMFRGVSLNDNSPALQGGVDWAAEDSGWYAGAWASQTDDGEETDIEVDLFGGYAGEFANGVEYDFMLIYYALVDASEYNYFELHGGFSKAINDSLSLGINLDYTNDSLAASGFGDDMSALHYSVVADVAIGEDMGLGFELGRQTWDEDGFDDDYTWGRVSLTKDWENWSFDVSAWYNDIDGDDSSNVTASVSYNF